MTFRLRIAPLAQRQMDAFAVYLREYDEALAIEQIERLNRISQSMSPGLRSPGVFLR